MLPVPPLYVADSFDVPPALMVCGFAAKLWIAGGGTTVTVTCCDTSPPAMFVTVSVYVVVAAGVTVTLAPLEIAPTPWSTLPAPPLYVAVSTEEPPAPIDAGVAVKVWMMGSGATVIVALAVAV